MTKNVALYLRVSTDDQTVENQRQALTEACERDIHHASERQDPEDDRAVQQPRGREGDRPISAGDDARLVALFDRTSREIRRGRRLRAGLHAVQDEAGVLEDVLALFEIPRLRVAATGGRIGDEHGAIA